MGSWFVEDVRRELIYRFGETAEDVPNSVHAGGLWVRTSIDPVIQRAAEEAVRDGLVRYEPPRRRRGPAAELTISARRERGLPALSLPRGDDDRGAAREGGVQG